LHGLFDAVFYLETYPDVRAGGVDPLQHYLVRGWREGRNPSPGFETRFYLDAYADARASGLNPLVHHALYGAREGRLTRRPMPAERRALRESLPPALRAFEWLHPTAGGEINAPALREALAAATTGTAIVVSVSHDDYLVSHGGIQNCIGDEERAIREAGWHYLHLSPAQPLPLLAEYAPAAAFRVVLTLDGVRLGHASFAAVTAELTEVDDRGVTLHLVVHHLMGHVPELIGELATVCGTGQTLFWAHDFFALCDGYVLLRNDAVFCHAPPPSSGACTICCYGASRARHLMRIADLFEALKPTVLFPSDSARDIWLTRGSLAHGDCLTQPLARLAMDGPVINEGADHCGALRVGFIGGPGYHKGWPLFAELAQRHCGDPRYSFFRLGIAAAGTPSGVDLIEVRVTGRRRDAMAEAVAAARIDVAVLFPPWPETFSFVAHEAVAGGALVVTHPGAGNIWPVVSAPDVDQGLCLADGEALFAAFADDTIVEAAARRRRRGRILIETPTARLLGVPGALDDLTGG
jgi:hypothetical protein